MSQIEDFLSDKPSSQPKSGGDIDSFLSDAPKSYGLKDFGGDLASVVTKGVVAVPQALVGLADIATSGQAGKALENAGVRFNEANQIADSWKSDSLKAQQKEFQDAQGIGGKAVAALSNPGLVASTVAESIPSMFLGGALAKGIGLAAPALAGRAGLTAAGEGLVGAGSLAESVRQQTTDGLLTPTQSALAAGAGVATAGLGALGARAGKALGVGDIDSMIANGATQGVAREGMGLASRVGRGALSEGVFEELPQSLSETAFENVALGKPVTEGMDEAAVLGALSGGLMGGVAGGLSRPAKPSQQMGIDPNAGPLSRAAASAVDSQPVPPAEPTQSIGGSITGTAPESLMGRASDPLAAQIMERRQQEAVDATPAQQSEPIPLGQRSLDELRQAFRSAQDPAIRKTLAAEIRKRREAMPDPLAQPQQETSLEPKANKTIKGKTPREKAGAEGAIEELASGLDGFEAVGPKQPSDERAREANFLSNLSNRQSFIDKGLDGLNVDEFAAVQRLMLRSAKDDEVLKAVVELIPVDVVDVLRSQQLTPEMVFHNPSMLKSGGVRSNTNNPVSIPVDAASKIVRAMAGVAAKDLAVNKLPHSGGLPVNGGSAGNAVVPTAISSGLLGDDGTVVSSLLGGGASKGGGTRGIAENVRGTNDLGGVPDNGGSALVAIGGNQNSAPNNVAIINEAEQASEEEPQAPAPSTNKLKEARNARRAADELRGTTGASTVTGGDITPSGVESPVADVRSGGRNDDAGTAQPDANGVAGRAVGSTAQGSAALKERKYNLVAINEKSGEKTLMNSSPLSHQEAVTMKNKTSVHPSRRVQLEEISAANQRPDNWRGNAIKAGKVARSLGLDPKGKRLKEIVAEIDAMDSEAEAPARRKKILDGMDGMIGSTRRANIEYVAEQLRDDIAAFSKMPFMDEAIADAKQKLADYEAIKDEAMSRDRRDQMQSIQRSMLLGARDELNAAVKNGEITQEQADDTVEQARATGNAAGAVNAIEAVLDSREQAIRDAWRKEPRTIGKWTPITVTAEGQTAQMLVNQKRAGGDKDGALHVVNIRMGKMLKDMEREPIAYTFRLTADNRLVEEGIPTVATPGQIAAWKGAGFALDDAQTNVQNTPQGTAGEAKAPAVEASKAEGGNEASNAGVPAARVGEGVRADGVGDLGPETFAGSIKREIESRAAEAERKDRARKPSPPAKAQPQTVDTEVYRATPDGAGKFTLESEESTIAGNGDATPRKFASESDALAWAKKNGFKTAAPGAGDVQADGVKEEAAPAAKESVKAEAAAQAEKPAEDDAFMGVKDDAPARPRKGKITAEQYESNLSAWANGAPKVMSDKADDYAFKSGQSVLLEAFHGTGRGDRVGTKFLKKRATSGPMSFFTSSPELAGGYATGKQDTSLSNEDISYADWFKYQPKGQRSPIPLDRAWYFMDAETKQRILDRMPDIRTDDDGNIIYEEGGGDIGSYEWNLKQTQKGFDKRGNPLAAAIETWLMSGSLFNEEQDFMKVLKLAGVPVADITYDNPGETFPFVYKTWVRMNNPLVTSDVPVRVQQALKAAALKDRSRAQASGVDTWDKNTRTLRDWVDQYFNAPNGDNKYVWTSIPDKVTEVFKAEGYDGIIDWSGKGGGATHPVYIPFEQNQVKSAIGNSGKFDPNKDDIMAFGSESKTQLQGTPVDRAIMDMAGEGREANEILSFIAKTSKSPYRRQLAQRLLATGANPAVSLGGEMGGGAGFRFLAKYSRKNHEVTLSEAASDRAEQIFLHETTHAATLLALDKGGLIATQMKRLAANVYKDASPEMRKMYGLVLDKRTGEVNVGEFVAEAFTNPDFQKALKGMKADNGSLWDRLVNIVRRILGMEPRQQDALSKALELGAGVMRENIPLRAARSFRAEDGPAYAGDMKTLSAQELEDALDAITGDDLEDDQVFSKKYPDADDESLSYIKKLGANAVGSGGYHVYVRGDGVKEAGPHEFFFYDNNDEFIGLARLTKGKDQASINMIAFTEDARGSGFGKAFYKYLLDDVGVNVKSDKEITEGTAAMYKSLANDYAATLDADGRVVLAAKSFRAEDGPAFAGIDQTETPEFKRWFGDSKVVDANGKPMVVYHGSSADFNAFDPKRQVEGSYGKGFYFSDRSATSEKFGAVREFFVALQNPASMQDGLAVAFDAKKLQRKGFDGILIKNKLTGETTAVAFRPEQIKSATGNNGNFDPDDADISHFGIADAVEQIKAFDVKEAPKNTWAHYRGMALQALGRRQLVDLYGDEFGTHMHEYDTLVQQMDAEKNETGAEADDIAQRWGKLKDEKALAELMHDATLAKMDPDKPMPAGYSKAEYDKLKTRFNTLSPEAKTLYRQARDMYVAHYKAVQQAIKDRIERSEMSPSEKKRMMAQLDDKLFKELQGVYFPLARFGQYVIVVKDANGEVKNVTRAETVKEAEQARKELQKAFPAHMGNTVGKVLKQAEFNAGRDAVGKGFMADLMNALDEKGVDDELRDTVAQLYLSSLPDLSWAKHGIHRKGTPGFSQDARRAFAQNAFHGARYLAKLRYSDRLQDELTGMQEYVKAFEGVEEYDSIQGQQVVDEMVKRHEILMNPKSSPVSTALTSFGFLFHMGLSPASAMVNLTQTALVAFPQMGAKWGFTKAGAALTKASEEVVRAKNDLSKALKGDELAAFDRAVKDGTIDVTMAHDLAGIAQGEDQGVMWKVRPVMRWASAMFHHAEKFNRQATFLAAYRLSKETNQGRSEDWHYEEAKKSTYDGHFDYSAANRARIMQGNWQRVILLFKQYSQSMIYTLARNAYQSVKAIDPKERTQARKTLGGILAAHAAAAGVLGLPIVGPLLTVASWIGGDDDEPWDAEVAMQNAMAEMIGPKAAEVVARGFSRLTPFDLSGRVALNKLILPDVQEGLEGKEWAESAMAAALGPVAGIGVNMARGAQKITEGDYLRGMEDMMPTALRGPLKALRYANEGAVDKTGIVITDEVGAAGVLGQASGFSPSQVRRDTERRSAIYAYDRALLERRSVLMRMMAEARIQGDTETQAEVQKDIQRFNEKNPTRRITPMNIAQSVRNRRKRIDEADQGVYLPSKRRDALDAVSF